MQLCDREEAEWPHAEENLEFGGDNGIAAQAQEIVDTNEFSEPEEVHK